MNSPPVSPPVSAYPRTSRALLFVLLFLVVVALAVMQFRRPILDWISLRNYTPPASIAALAKSDTMTGDATRMFYVNRPTIDSKAVFDTNCHFGSEQSIVIGCYHSNQAGIHLLDVTDARLNGVEQVTAAHEMLHAAYDRLSKKEQTHINTLLQDYYDKQVTDMRVRATIDQYRKTEPDDVVNEMHSIFATEIPHLPTELETYYARYFTDRSKVTDFAAAYSGEFTRRQQQVAAYDVELAQIKSTIDANMAELSEQQAIIQTQRNQLNSERTANPQKYNQDVDAYNARVVAYNAKIVSTRNLVSEYNSIVDKRNAIALEEKQLAQAISGNSVPAAQ